MPLRQPYTVTPVSTRPPWSWAGAGVVVGILITLILCAPAQWLASYVEKSTGNRVQLTAARGTIWTGSAQLVLSAGSGSQAYTALPGRVEWQVRPGLQGLQLTLKANCCLSEGWKWTIAPTISGVRISLSDISPAQPSRWPSSLLAGLGTPWNTLQFDGTLSLSTQQLELQLNNGNWNVAGQAQLDLIGMSTRLSSIKPLGSYRMTLVGGPTPTLDLSTLQGSLQLTGSGSWVGGRLQFDGQASATPEQSEALGNLLNIIGRRDGARSIIKVG